MNGKLIVITGASDGIGKAASRLLAARGHHVVVVGRARAKSEALARELGSWFHVADFRRLQDVHALADALLAGYPRIDVLVNNAGEVFGPDRRLTPDGHEATFQVNYLAPFLLTTRLLDRLIASRATVISTSSTSSSILGHLDLADLENESGFEAAKAYGDSKLALILFTRELHRRYRAQGLAAAAFHPGHVATGFASAPDAVFRSLYLPPLRELWLGSPDEGADTLVFLAEGQPDVDFPSGEFFYQRQVAKANQQADDPGLARALWERSEDFVRDSEGALR